MDGWRVLTYRIHIKFFDFARKMLTVTVFLFFLFVLLLLLETSEKVLIFFMHFPKGGQTYLKRACCHNKWYCPTVYLKLPVHASHGLMVTGTGQVAPPEACKPINASLSLLRLQPRGPFQLSHSQDDEVTPVGASPSRHERHYNAMSFSGNTDSH